MRRDPLAVLRRGRTMAEALMLDRGEALRPTGEGYEVVDGVEVEKTAPLFGQDDPIPCKIQTRNLTSREEEVGDRTAATIRIELHLPVSAPALQRGDIWLLTVVHPESLQTAGQRLRVVAPVSGTLKTARRYEVEEVV